jgi:hypothetical protein
MRRVPIAMKCENASPRRILANSAFQRSETAPSGARITTGNEAIWNTEPRMLEVMKMVNPRSHNLKNGCCYEDTGGIALAMMNGS